MRLRRKFSAAALLCAMLTYPFGQRGPNGNGLSRPLSYRDNVGEWGRERERERERFSSRPLLTIQSASSPRSFTRLLLSLFSLLLQPLSFISLSIAIIFHSLSVSPLPLSPCCLSYSRPPFISSPTTKASVRPPLCVCLLIHRVPFSLSLSPVQMFSLSGTLTSPPFWLFPSQAGSFSSSFWWLASSSAEGKRQKKEEEIWSSRDHCQLRESQLGQRWSAAQQHISHFIYPCLCLCGGRSHGGLPKRGLHLWHLHTAAKA